MTFDRKGGDRKSGKGAYMKQNTVIDFTQYRKKEDRNRKRLNKGKKKGSVYSRNGKLWVDFRYLDQRVREPSGLNDTPENKKVVRKQLDLITAEIENGVFEFEKRFSHSKKKDFFTELEGKTVRKNPKDILFGDAKRTPDQCLE